MSRPDPDAPIRVAAAQVAPVLLDRAATLDRVVARVREAGRAGCRLVAFGESLVPGYPVWLDRTGGARFDDPLQKAIHARYLREAVDVDGGDLDPVREAAREAGTWVVLGVAERAGDRGGHSIHCSCVTIDDAGAVASVHRKLVPTYEERLAWAPGDGHGLVVHRLGPFTLGSLNCWENWMPLARAALHAQGEDLHVGIWPGRVANTEDVTRFVAREGRSYVVGASALLRPGDVPADVPGRDELLAGLEEDAVLHDGGSCIAGPDGAWVVPPQAGVEGLVVAELDPVRVREERQNFDPSGHYARPEVLGLVVDRRRATAARFVD